MTKHTSNVDVIINGRTIGYNYQPYVVAEMSGNHNQDINRAFKIIDEAKAAGADAVKLQTYKPDTITIDSDNDEFIVNGGLWDGRKLYDLYEEAHTPWEWHKDIFEYAKKIGITIFSTPFDNTAVDLLEELNAPAYKIASPELIDLGLIEKVASTKKPIILSTGASNFSEISEAVYTARKFNSNNIILLHCTASYPAPYEEANLSTLLDMASQFKVVVGLSDHTLGTSVSELSIMLGASFIEKHFTLSRSEGGVDSKFSLEPKEFKKLVEKVNKAKLIFGKPTYGPTPSEDLVLKNRRSLYVVKDINCGETFSHNNIRSIRPGLGMKPKYLKKIIGQKATQDILAGTPVRIEMIKNVTDLEN